MILVGLDPSFTCSGVSVMDTDKKEIRISDVRTGKSRKSFEKIFWRGVKVHDGVGEIIKSVGEPDLLISEKPYAGGQFSEGLFLLDSTMFLDFIYRYKSLQRVYLISARFLSHVHKENNIKKYSKSDSTKLVREGLLPVFEEYGFDIEYGNKFKEKQDFKGGLNNNTAESFIFLSRLFISKNSEYNFYNDSGLIDDIYNVARGLFDGSSEEELFNRDDII